MLLFNGVSFGRLVFGWCRGTQLLFNWFEGWNLLGDDQNFKKGLGIQKKENQMSRGDFFFFVSQSKLLSHFFHVFPDTTLKERSLG